MHVDVDADRRQVEADGDGQVRGLAADARQFAQFLDGARQRAAELLLEDARQLLEVARLVAEEADGVDELFDLLDGEALQVGGRERLPARGREEPLDGARRAGVLRAGGEDGADKHAEGVVRLRLDEFDDRRGVRGEFLFERAVDGGDVFQGHAHSISNPGGAWTRAGRM